ncbi:hypothetical protein DL766_010483 [Monosporascus sp. MC13-8B]|uniref:Uncharacterized protein n=1 Tax=Monosporascus cannonballus TaxID=155416 RepID=A0ABY0HEE8_9PEZI|nr:hypothetical protein DL763_005527 [Monosporascus cannonballus]RYO91592.1 hypothetical protein DL762_002125 [Monosporascus cannonballus]RYP02225.1 hypothetical protein DL766_010483 [Monosporascus sp. MC13-8B]
MSADDSKDIFLVQFVSVDSTGGTIRGKSSAGPVMNNSGVDAIDMRAIRGSHEPRDVPAAAEIRHGDPGAIAASASTSRTSRTRNPLMSAFDGPSDADPQMTPLTPMNTKTNTPAANPPVPPPPPMLQVFRDAAKAFHREHHTVRRVAMNSEGLMVTSVRVVWRDVGLGATDLLGSTPGAFERQLELVRRRGYVDHLRVCYSTSQRQSFAGKVLTTFTMGRAAQYP